MCVVRTLSWTVQVSPATKHKIVLNSTRQPVQISPATTPQQQQYPATWPSDHICADSWYPATYKGRSSNYWVLNPAPYDINKSLRGRKGSMRRCSTWFFSLTAWRIGEIWRNLTREFIILSSHYQHLSAQWPLHHLWLCRRHHHHVCRGPSCNTGSQTNAYLPTGPIHSLLLIPPVPTHDPAGLHLLASVAVHEAGERPSTLLRPFNPARVVKKILNLEFVDMAEITRDGNCEPVPGSNTCQQHVPTFPNKRLPYGSHHGSQTKLLNSLPTWQQSSGLNETSK